MSPSSSLRSGADIVSDTLYDFGVRHVCHIPGEGILEMVDALALRHPDITLTTFRHEGGMAYAAQAIGRMTEQPGICLAARAPGALNTLLALHTADTDAAPLILIVGQAPADQAGFDPLSGSDLGEVFRPVVKRVFHASRGEQLPTVLARAWREALSGRMGPVVVIVPEDVVHAQVLVAGVPLPVVHEPSPDEAAMAALVPLLRAARRPLLIVGGTGWSERALGEVKAFCAAHNWPVVTTYRRGDLIDHADPHFAGEIGIGIDPSLAEAIADADLVLAVNVRLGEINSFGAGGFGGFKLFHLPIPAQPVVQVHAEAGELGRAYQPALTIHAGPARFMAALRATQAAATAEAGWTERLSMARRRFVESGVCDGPVDLKQIFTQMRAQLPDDAVVTVGAGAYAVWLHRYFSLHAPHTLLGPKSGAMGYGLAAAIGVSLAAPARRVIALAGDGCFLMHGEELATAVQYGLPIIVVIVNNSGYGAIRGTQKKLFGRAIGTDLHNPSFADYARAFGAHGEVVATTDEFLSAFARCLATGGPAVLELVLPATVGKPL